MHIYVRKWKIVHGPLTWSVHTIPCASNAHRIRMAPLHELMANQKNKRSSTVNSNDLYLFCCWFFFCCCFSLMVSSFRTHSYSTSPTSVTAQSLFVANENTLKAIKLTVWKNNSFFPLQITLLFTLQNAIEMTSISNSFHTNFPNNKFYRCTEVICVILPVPWHGCIDQNGDYTVRRKSRRKNFAPLRINGLIIVEMWREKEKKKRQQRCQSWYKLCLNVLKNHIEIYLNKTNCPFQMHLSEHLMVRSQSLAFCTEIHQIRTHFLSFSFQLHNCISSLFIAYDAERQRWKWNNPPHQIRR